MLEKKFIYSWNALKLTNVNRRSYTPKLAALRFALHFQLNYDNEFIRLRLPKSTKKREQTDRNRNNNKKL